MNRSAKMVLILGMHRSGTSCLAGMLKTSGLFLGEEIQTQNRFNIKGNQENVPVRSINRRLMELNSGTWYDPKPILNVPMSFQIEADETKAKLRTDGRTFGIKDPRMLYCLDIWRDEATILIGTIRHPSLVVQSLIKRNKHRAVQVDTDWYNTWFEYNSVLLSTYDEERFPIVNFDWEDEKYSRAVRKIAESMNLNSTESFFDPKLRHQTSVRSEAPEHCEELYRQLADIAEAEYRVLFEKGS